MIRALALAALLFAAPLLRAEELVDLNAATPEQLENLPGIGPSKARAIAQDREQHGPFKSVDDLDRVKGIGPKMIDRLRAHVRVASSGAAPAKAAPPPPATKAPAAPPPPAPAPAPKAAKSAPPAKAAPEPNLDALDRESPDGKVNLNLATEEELQQIDGITGANAKIIVAWREKKGPFRHIAELAKVPGLPPKLLQTVQFFVTVRFDARKVSSPELVDSGISKEAADAVMAARQKRGGLSAADLDTVPGLSADERATLRILLWFP